MMAVASAVKTPEAAALVLRRREAVGCSARTTTRRRRETVVVVLSWVVVRVEKADCHRAWWQGKQVY